MLKFATAIVSGVLLAIPPGPATTSLLVRARESRKRAFSSMNQILLADVAIFGISFLLFEWIGTFIHGAIVGAIAGIFLIIFALKFFLTEQKQDKPKTQSTFRLTFFNPTCWIGAFGIIAFSLQNSKLDWGFLAAFEFGVLLWYLILIEFIRKISERTHLLLLRGVVALIGVMGVGLILKSALSGLETFRFLNS